MKREYTNKSAEISECGKYRWKLVRVWGDHDTPIVFVGLNPSTADGEKDDATIRRVVSFADRAGHQAVIMLNLFAFRVTNPRILESATDPIGEKNDGYLQEYTRAYRTVCAWGSHRSALIRDRARDVLDFLPEPYYCLGKTRDGGPRHPLYVKGATTLTRYQT